MIRTKDDLIFYLEKDREALKRPARKRFAGSFKDIVKRALDPDEIWRFERVLRYTEYYSRNFEGINRFLFWWYYFKYKRLSLKLGFSIPLDVFGPGLSIAHYGTILVINKTK
jgi:serine O-acetyltransferase